MREIKFRGKRKHDGKFVYGYYTKIDYYAKYDEVDNIVVNEGLDCHSYPVILETVGQYTGLKDKNGKEIYEGDIFKFKDEVWESSYTPCGTEYDSWEVENYAVVGYNEETARFDFVKYKFNENSVEADLHENHDLEFADFVSELEIIGNIYDNSELLIGDDEIDDIRAADVQAVKYGYWEEITDYGGWGDTRYRCSVCGEEWHLEDGKPKDNNMNLCPRCGARMEMMNNGKL